MALVAPVTIRKVTGETVTEKPDLLAVEEPLEIRLGFGPMHDRQQRSVSVTMRTPGHDQELAMGFLFTEGIVHKPDDIVSCRHCVQDEAKEGNVLRVELKPDVLVDWARLERNTFTSSSCGLCGKATIEAVMSAGTSLQEVVVRAGENPAFRVLRQVRKNRSLNDRSRLKAYEYDSYQKTEIALSHLTDRMRQSLLP